MKLLREVEVVVEEPPFEPGTDGTGAEVIGETDSGEAEGAADDQCDSAVEECE